MKIQNPWKTALFIFFAGSLTQNAWALRPRSNPTGPGPKPPATATAPAEPQDILVKVDGMTCSSCVNRVKKELAKLTAEKYKDKKVQFEVVVNEVKAFIQEVKAAGFSTEELAELKKDIAEAVKKAGYTPKI